MDSGKDRGCIPTGKRPGNRCSSGFPPQVLAESEVNTYGNRDGQNHRHPVQTGAWFGTDYNMNIYRGCCHGCIYCDSRSECYHIDRFDTVRAKENTLQIIRDDLQHKAKTGVVGTGAMSDPYNPFEEKELLTRHALELLDAFGFGAAIATKSDLIIRDLDVLKGIQEHSPVLCKVTVTTLDDRLASKIEPHAPSSSRRLNAVERLAGAGIFTGILLMPVLPFLEDNEENILGIVRRAAECGARFIYPAFGVTLRQNQREYFLEKLEEAFPGKASRNGMSAGMAPPMNAAARRPRRFGIPLPPPAARQDYCIKCRILSGDINRDTEIGN